MDQQEQDLLELGSRPALALVYSPQIQYRLWRMGYDYRSTIYTHMYTQAYEWWHKRGTGEGEGSGSNRTVTGLN